MPGIRARIMLQGHLWIHVTVGEVKTAPTRRMPRSQAVIWSTQETVVRAISANVTFQAGFFYGREFFLPEKFPR
jgi:hypothetical protein